MTVEFLTGVAFSYLRGDDFTDGNGNVMATGVWCSGVPKG